MQEEETQEVSTEKEAEQKKRKLSHDPDATFLKKVDSCTLGYKGYFATDEEGFGEKVVVRPANESEQINFHRIAEPKYFEGRWVYAYHGISTSKQQSP